MERLTGLIRKVLGGVEGFEFEIRTTEGPGHATTLAREAADAGYDIAVAVGGDGTVNEVASGLVGGQTPLGLVPSGSGNAFGRSLGISTRPLESLSLLAEPNIQKIDAGVFNDRPFFSTAGIGFDALVAAKFQEYAFRGPIPYFLISFKEFFKYRPGRMVLELGGERIERTPLFTVFANTPQYGNGAVIAPDADYLDGLLDICVLDKVSALETIMNLPRLFTGRLNKASFYSSIKAKEFRVHMDRDEVSFHVDGEPGQCGREISVKTLPKALRVCIPHNQSHFMKREEYG